MKLLVEIDDGVYGTALRDFAKVLEQEVNCLLDDAYSQHIKVTVIPPGRLAQVIGG